MSKQFKAGDRVQFSDSFIESLNDPEEVAGRRGEVENIREIGFPGHMMQIVSIAWDAEEWITDEGGGNLDFEDAVRRAQEAQ